MQNKKLKHSVNWSNQLVRTKLRNENNCDNKMK